MKVTELAIYPIKSTKQMSVQEIEVDTRGFRNDRLWVLADDNGHFITQRHYPQLVRIQANPVADGLLVEAEGFPHLMVKTPDVEGNLSRVSVWKDQCQAADGGDTAAQWFSDFLGTSCRLYFQPEQAVRSVDQRFAREEDKTGFADGFPFLLTSESSLAELNSRLPSPVPMKRFRSNIVVDGLEAFAEDNWKLIQIRDVVFRVVKPCSRCVMITIDTDTGVKSGKEPLSTLASYRKSAAGVIFGQNLIHNNTGIIRVGDKVKVL